jgi:hypothetical protein
MPKVIIQAFNANSMWPNVLPAECPETQWPQPEIQAHEQITLLSRIAGTHVLIAVMVFGPAFSVRKMTFLQFKKKLERSFLLVVEDKIRALHPDFS